MPERRAAFAAGLERLGFTVVDGVTNRPGDRDILVTWNLIRDGRIAADRFAAIGRPVIVAENASWGNGFRGGHWYTLARGRHNTAGAFSIGDAHRWDSLGVELEPWRADGETVLLPQRGIGPAGVAMPADWIRRNAARGRIRPHPGQGAAIPLEQDLAHAAQVITWGSGAAIKALIWGIRVESHMPNWIGEQDNTDAGRLAMFRRLAWAQWQLSEISHGEPFARLLT